MDPGLLKGAYYQWTQPNGVYDTDPDWVTLVVYPKGVDVPQQRLICAKELIHVCDKGVVKTTQPDELVALARKLVGMFEPANADSIDLAASIDKIAQYQSLCLLFPAAARDRAREILNSDSSRFAEIVDWVQLPEDQCHIVLDPRFDQLIAAAVAIGNGEHLA